MITVAVIAFREFLEAFLIVGVFLGISKKLKIKREFEIIIASIVGILMSILLATGTFLYGNQARGFITEKSAKLLESYLMIFSGVFLAYVVFSLHNVLRKNRGQSIIDAHNKLQKNVFDFSLFWTIVFLVFREGFEIALFTASTALFSVFIQNFLGLMIGFLSATTIGTLTFFTYVKLPLNKIYKMTEYMIILLGASLVQNGITELLKQMFKINLSYFVTLPLSFLPDKENVFGHLLNSFLGLDREFSLGRLLIMIAYVFVVYRFFMKKKRLTVAAPAS